MSDKLLTRDDFENLLRQWKKDHGVEVSTFGQVSRWGVPVSSDERRTMYNTLMRHLIDVVGYDKTDLRSQMCKMAVVNASVPLGYKKKTQLNAWIKLAQEDWDAVVDVEFEAEEHIKEAPMPESKFKNNKKPSPYQKPKKPDEMAPDTPMLDRSKLTGPKPTSVIDDSIDIFDGALDEADNE
jgi:hypothetical protein